MNDEDFSRLLRERLKPWQEPPSPSVAGRLRAARRTALSQPSARMHSGWSLAALASVVVVSVFVVVMLKQHDIDPAAIAVDDMVLMTSEDDFELYQDIEFLLWLGELDDAEIG